jgi:putative hydrolase of the HAD superfamily
MIKAIIFDLDNCIFDSHTLGEDILAPILAPLIASDVPEETKRAAGAALWHSTLADVAARFNLPPNVAEAMRRAYEGVKVPEGSQVKSYGDEDCIKTLPVKKYLVTSGYQKFQELKIEVIKVAPLFDEIIIDATDKLDARKGKTAIFKEIPEANNWDKSELLVVGDNPGSELGAAKSLGIPTVQTLRPGIKRWDGADYHIDSLSELAGIISK